MKRHLRQSNGLIKFIYATKIDLTVEKLNIYMAG